ncbi:hypothetical protein PPEP_a0566 [Pseudoalteromonas peptidolytica F12-50-A1]|uniref:Uncharacterized protein n=1 Tax=Pseudoalteromonas peptidolytica F12-50-A1 TaxID=1315280 RepID=A0A8I0MTW6_9GAMM|nr:hypothetical protein [Pseudoalteromonas peptidolytica F12-50-A1]
MYQLILILAQFEVTKLTLTFCHAYRVDILAIVGGGSSVIDKVFSSQNRLLNWY